MTKKELERLVIAITHVDTPFDPLFGKQLARLFNGLIAIGVDEDSHVLKFWNVGEYDTAEHAIEFLWRHREELPN